MTPRVRINWIRSTAKPSEVAETVRRTGEAHLVLCSGSLDGRVIGMLNARRYLAASRIRMPRKKSSYCNPIAFVPETARLDQLLDRFRSDKLTSALVVDEHGSIVGLVTIRDIVERLVTELTLMEPDRGDSSDDLRMIGLGRWLVPGQFPVRDWARSFSINSDLDATTVGGLLVARLGRVPRQGESVTIANVRLTADRVEGLVVGRVMMELLDQIGSTGQEEQA